MNENYNRHTVPERSMIMNKTMMNMEELEQVSGGDFYTVMFDWVLFKRPEQENKRRVKEQEAQKIRKMLDSDNISRQ